MMVYVAFESAMIAHTISARVASQCASARLRWDCFAAPSLLRSAHRDDTPARDGAMRKIKKFEPLSVMKISAICYGILGVVEGVIFGVVFSIVPMKDTAGQSMPHVMGPVLGVLFVVLLPIAFGIVGAIAGGLGAVIYNVSARYVGGIQVEVE